MATKKKSIKKKIAIDHDQSTEKECVICELKTKMIPAITTGGFILGWQCPECGTVIDNAPRS